MRNHSDTLLDVLQSGSFNARIICDAFRGADRLVKDLDISEWDLRWDREAELKSGGSCTALVLDDFGRSFSPEKATDPLAAFGSELNILMEIWTSDETFAETIQLGHFRIGEVPSKADELADFGDATIVTASVVEMNLEDRLSRVKRRGFRSDENPQSTSAWGELARITAMQVIRHPSLPDATLPTDMVYKAVRGGRLAAVRDIAEILGGTEYTTSDGAVSVLPFVAGDPVATLHLGEFGTIIGDSEGMDSAEVYNVVVGNFETVDRVPIYSIAIATGDLAPTSEYDENTYYHSNASIKTQSAGDAEVATVLSQLIDLGPSRVAVTCIINPLVELGDVVLVERRNGTFLKGQVVKVRLDSSMRMYLELDVLDGE